MIWEQGASIQGEKERYRLQVRLSSPGAYGEIWRVQSDGGHTWIAKRALPQGRPDLLREIAFFKAEAARTGPAVSAPLHDVGVDLGDPFFVRRLYDGDLAAWAAGRPPLGERLQVLADLANAVGRLHGRAVVHRDLKPENVLYLRFLDRVQPILADASLYRELGLNAAQTGRGTPDYMSWEAGLSGRPVTPAVDVFAIGALTFWVLTGRRAELAEAHQTALTAAGHRAQMLSRFGPLSPERVAELAALVARPDEELVALGGLRSFGDRDRDALLGALVELDAEGGTEALIGAVEGCLGGDTTVRSDALAGLVAALRVAADGASPFVEPARPEWVLDPPASEVRRTFVPSDPSPPSLKVPSVLPAVLPAPARPAPARIAPRVVRAVAPTRSGRVWPWVLVAAAVLAVSAAVGVVTWRATTHEPPPRQPPAAAYPSYPP